MFDLYLISKLEGEVGVELCKRSCHAHSRQGLANAVTGAITEGEPPFTPLAGICPNLIYFLLHCYCLCFAGREG